MRNKETYIFLNNIYNLIVDKKFDEALSILDNMDKVQYREYNFEIKYLIKLINEKKHFDDIFGTDKYHKFKLFLQGGKDSSYYGNSYDEYNYYTAGLYVTEEPLFYYLIGKSLFGDEEKKEEAIKLFSSYINSTGASKLYKAYEYMGKYYRYIDINKSRKYYRRYNRLCLLMNINNVLFDENAMIHKVLLKRGE